MTFNPFTPVARTAGAESPTLDLGLRQNMLRVYNLMAGSHQRLREEAVNGRV
jgi:hypothetical protein